MDKTLYPEQGGRLDIGVCAVDSILLESTKNNTRSSPSPVPEAVCLFKPVTIRKNVLLQLFLKSCTHFRHWQYATALLLLGAWILSLGAQGILKAKISLNGFSTCTETRLLSLV